MSNIPPHAYLYYKIACVSALALCTLQISQSKSTIAYCSITLLAVMRAVSLLATYIIMSHYLELFHY